MPEYPFKKPDGTITTRVMTMREAPSIGEVVDIDGERCVRVASEFRPQGEAACRQFPYESYSLPDTIGKNGDAKLSARGKVIVQSKEHRANICAKYGYMVE